MQGRPGELVGGRYRVERTLGRGGMGLVLRAHDEKLDRPVALKVLSPEAIGDAALRARLVREARTAARFEHPGVVHVYDVGETEDGGAFVAMELVEGATLRELATRHALTPAEIVRLGAEAARALAAAHAAGLVHRDVKPDNLMRRADGRAVVLDFGIAKELGGAHDPTHTALTDDGAIVGTPAYLSPEQARGAPLDARSDQFSLAVSLYELLSGSLPWKGTSAVAMIASILSDAPRTLELPDAALATQLDAVLQRALAKSPDDRFPDCSALADALGATLGDAPGTPRALASLLPSGAITAVRSEAPAAPRTDPLAATVAAPSTGGLRTPPARRAAPAIAAGVVVAVVFAAAFALWPRSEPHDAAPLPVHPAPLDEHDTVACPVLEVEGEPEPGWLGAAVAGQICDRLVWIFGGRFERTLAPAELLELGVEPAGEAPGDPYAAADARSRSLAAAEARASVVLDGTLRRRRGEVVLEARLFRPGGGVLASLEVEGTPREVAVALTDRWRRDRVLPEAPLDEDVASWWLVDDVDEALLRHDARTSTRAVDDATTTCAALAARAPGDDALRRAWLLERCATDDDGPPALDTSSPARLAASTMLGAHDEHALALVREARAEARSAIGRSRLALAEARVLEHESAHDRSWDAALAAATSFPRTPDAWMEGVEVWTSPAALEVATRWIPGDPQAWTSLASALDAYPTERTLELLRRAWAIAPRSTSTAADLAFAALRLGRIDEARRVAAALAGIDADHDACAEMLGIAIASADGRFADAVARATAFVAETEQFASFQRQDLYFALWLAEATPILGDTALADAYVERVLLGPAPRFENANPFNAEVVTVIAILSAGPALRARALASAPVAILEGASVLPVGPLLGPALEGRAEEVAPAMARVLTEAVAYTRPAAAAVFAPYLEAHGREAILEDVDTHLVAEAGLFHGIGPAHVRAARRAAGRGNLETARALAGRIVDALGTADVEVPLLAEMRDLAGREGRRRAAGATCEEACTVRPEG